MEVKQFAPMKPDISIRLTHEEASALKSLLGFHVGVRVDAVLSAFYYNLYDALKKSGVDDHYDERKISFSSSGFTVER